MNPCRSLHLLAVVGVFLLAATSARAADPAVTVTLEQARIVSAANGKEAREPAPQSKPGDVIEYTAVYRNTSSAPVTQVLATLPVPTYTTFLPGSAHPAVNQASIDHGATFAPTPLRREVRDAKSGAKSTAEVPPREYQALRWVVAKLAPGESRTFSARVRVDRDEPPEPAKPAASTPARAATAR